MALPKLSHPVFQLNLPSTGQVISYRPFLVREEMILLVAQQSQNQIDVINAIKQVINNCITTENVSVDDFATFDLEYFFIQLRSKSVNSVVKLSYKDNEDGKIYDFEVDLESIQIKKVDEAPSTVKINDTMSLLLRYPRLDAMNKLADAEDSAAFTLALIKSCLNKIVDGDKEYLFSDSTDEEVEEFLNSLDVKTYEQINKFFDTLPKLEHILTYTNKTGREVTIKLDSLNDFFALG
jgi:hypothetical protein